MSTKSYSKSSSFHYDEMPTRNTQLMTHHMANEFCEPWQVQWTNAHLAHTSSPWQMCYDSHHIADHDVAKTARFLSKHAVGYHIGAELSRLRSNGYNKFRELYDSGTQVHNDTSRPRKVDKVKEAVFWAKSDAQNAASGGSVFGRAAAAFAAAKHRATNG